VENQKSQKNQKLDIGSSSNFTHMSALPLLAFNKKLGTFRHEENSLWKISPKGGAKNDDIVYLYTSFPKSGSTAQTVNGADTSIA
jgi:hypothetical protein